MNDSHREQDNYMAVWVWLTVLTVIEVLGARYLPIPKFYMALFLVAFALTKALLVALYYMHLKFERRRLILIAAVPLPLTVLLAIVGILETHLHRTLF